MSVDAEIVRIREAIALVHATFYGITREIQNITKDIDKGMDVFNTKLENVQSEVQHIRDGSSQIFSKFPSHTFYIGVLLIVDVLIWMLAGFLLFRIIQNCRNKKKYSEQIIAKYQQLMNPELHSCFFSSGLNPKTLSTIVAPTEIVIENNESFSYNIVSEPKQFQKVDDEQKSVTRFYQKSEIEFMGEPLLSRHTNS